MSLSENQLIEYARGGDLEAFSALARRFERRVYTLALHYTRDHADAEDLAQEVWLKAYKAINSFRSEASFQTWLRQILVHTFLNHRRASSFRWQTRRDGRPEDELTPDDEEMSLTLHTRLGAVEDEFERKILVERVLEALGELTSQQRLMFLLKHREGLTYEEIAQAFGCSAGTVKKGLYRAVAKLRERLGVRPAPVEYAQCGAGRNG